MEFTSYKLIIGLFIVIIAISSLSCSKYKNFIEVNIEKNIIQNDDTLFCQFNYINKSGHKEYIDSIEFTGMRVDIDKKTLENLESSSVKFYIIKKNFDPYLNEMIYIFFNDNTFKVVELYIKAPNLLEINPHSKQIVFYKKANSQESSQYFVILNHTQSPIKINNFYCSNPVFNTENTEYIVNPSDSVRIKLKCNSPKRGLECGELGFQTSDSSVRHQLLYLFAVDE